jgi:hypothetical protein
MGAHHVRSDRRHRLNEVTGSGSKRCAGTIGFSGRLSFFTIGRMARKFVEASAHAADMAAFPIQAAAVRADIHRGAEPSDPRRQRIEQPMIGWFQQ